MTGARLFGNRYELGELIGYGGMAEVHRGRDVRLGRDVAIKVLRADLARDPSFLNRFRREAQSAAGLNHPSIVSVYDTGEDLVNIQGEQAAVPYIVMEYVDGRTLRDILKSEGPIPPRRAMQIVAEVCGALDYSHRNGIIHRDIKPANVMITNTGAVKVMDFGIARAVADNAATVTQTAAVIGTAQYLSPEQARGETVDPRSDVYSAGCVLYELVTGSPPFKGDSPVAVAYQHVRENAALPSSLNPTLPRSVDSITMKALAKNPMNRYQTAGDMRLDLMRAVADQPVRAESVMNDEERTQFISRLQAPPRPSVLPLGDDGEEQHRRGALVWVAVVAALLLVIVGGAFAALQLTKNDKPKTVAMPGLIGMTQQSAVNVLQQKGLQPGTVTTITGPCGDNPDSAPTSVNPGLVCTQSQPIGESINLNSKVDFTVFKSPNVQVPQLASLSLSQAEEKLTALGLMQPTIKYQDTFSPAAGVVISSSPGAGTSVPMTQTVTLTVSTGKEAIPDVRNLKYDAARMKLNSQGFSNIGQPKFQTGTDQSKDGLVIDQDPITGTWPANQPITLTVYQYVAPAPVITGTCPTSGAPSSGASSSGAPSSSSPAATSSANSAAANTTCTPAPPASSSSTPATPTTSSKSR